MADVPFVAWHFDECNCGLIRYTTIRGGKHLVAKPRLSTLAKQADRRTEFAVSYAYGKKNRKSYVLGHVDHGSLSSSSLGLSEWCSTGRDFAFELADEWEPSAFAETLVYLCRNNRYGWIDQMAKHEAKEIQAEAYTPRLFTRRNESSASESDGEGGSSQGDDSAPDSDDGSSIGSCNEEAVVTQEDQGDGEKIKEVVKKIPGIYSLLPVVEVILPGHRCDCVRNSPDGDPNSWCMNGIVLSSWFSRVWTRQELMYARRVKFHWAGERLPKPNHQCITDSSQDGISWESFTRLNPILQDYLKDLFTIYASTGGTYDDAKLAAKLHSWQTPRVLITATRTKYHETIAKLLPSGNVDVPRDESSAWIKAVRELRKAQNFYVTLMRSAMCDYGKSADGRLSFMGGKALVAIPKTTTNNQDLPNSQSFQDFDRFVESLFRFSRSNRRATQLKDYVIAIFTDLPGYVSYTDEDRAREVCRSFLDTLNTPMQQLLRLLRHAIRQLTTKHEVMLLTTTPRGLFCTKESRCSWKWEPSEYMNVATLDIESVSAKDVYGALFPHTPIKLEFGEREAFVPLVMSCAGTLSLSQRSSSYKARLGGRAWTALEGPIRNTIANWPPEILERCQRPEVEILRRMLAQDTTLRASARSVESIAIESPLFSIGASMLKASVQPGAFVEIMINLIFIRNQRKRQEALRYLRLIRLGVNMANDLSAFICESLPRGAGHNPFVAQQVNYYIKKEQRRIMGKYKEDGVLKAQIDSKIYDALMGAAAKSSQLGDHATEEEEEVTEQWQKVVSKEPTEHGNKHDSEHDRLKATIGALVKDYESTNKSESKETEEPCDPSSAPNIADHEGVLRKIVLNALGLHQRLDGRPDHRLELVMTDEDVSPPSLGIFNKEKFAEAKDGLLKTKTLALKYIDNDGMTRARQDGRDGYGTLMYEVYASDEPARFWKVFGVWVPQVEIGTTNFTLASPQIAGSDVHWLG